MKTTTIDDMIERSLAAEAAALAAASLGRMEWTRIDVGEIPPGSPVKAFTCVLGEFTATTELGGGRWHVTLIHQDPDICEACLVPADDKGATTGLFANIIRAEPLVALRLWSYFQDWNKPINQTTERTLTE